MHKRVCSKQQPTLNFTFQLEVKWKNHTKALLLLLFLYEVSVKKAEKVSISLIYLYTEEKKKRGKRKKANQVLHHWKIAQCTGNWEHCDERAKRLKLNQLGGQEFFRTFLKVFQLFWFFLVTYTFPATAWWASGTKGAFVKYSTSLALSSEMQELPATISRDSQEILNKTREKIDLT